MRNLNVAVAALLAAISAGLPARADDQRVVDALNAPWKAVNESSKSWKPVLDAYAAMTAPPAVEGGLSATGIWPGMKDWEAVKAWAAANPGMGAALRGAESAVAFAFPYGRGSVPAGYAAKGLYVGIGDGLEVGAADVAYLPALTAIDAWVTAEMYRLGGDGKFDEAFGLGLSSMRFLRQVADQHLLAEKAAAMRALCDMASVQRDVLQTFLDKVPAEVVRKYARTAYATLRPADAERLRRIAMPEGDRVLAEALIAQVFDQAGQPDGERFVQAASAAQSRREPLGAFGAARRWTEIARVHGSLDATRIRLASIYDDWWRRWRARYYDTLLDNPTVISRTNPMRYALVLGVTSDLASLFPLRQWLNAELNGTALAFGVAAYYRSSGAWPQGIDATYGVSTSKRTDYDPWDRQRGRWLYERLASPKTMETPYGQLQVSGAVIYARGVDGQDGLAKSASLDGLTGDFVAWPALRAVSRGAAAQ
jgi:hypothetical protein